MSSGLQLQQLFCSRENQLASRFNQQNVKFTSYICSMPKSSRPINLHEDFYQKFRIQADWDENGKLFLHKNNQLITHAIGPPAVFSNLRSTKY